MKRVVILSLMLVATSVACTDGKSPRNERRVVASVDGVPIFSDEVRREFHRVRLQDEEGAPTVASDAAQKRALVDDMINRRLLLQEADRNNVIVSIDDVESAYQRVRGGWEDSAFAEVLEQKDMTPAELKRELRDVITIRKYFRDQVFARIPVTDDEIEGYLREHPEMTLEPEKIRVRQIVVKTQPEATNVQAELGRGMTFEDAAMKYSLTPDGKSGGDLGFFGRGTMPRFFDEVCFDLKIDEVSKVIPSEYGFHLFKLVDRRPEHQRSMEQVRDEVEALLRREKERDAQRRKIEELRRQSKIVIKEAERARIH